MPQRSSRARSLSERLHGEECRERADPQPQFHRQLSQPLRLEENYCSTWLVLWGTRAQDTCRSFGEIGACQKGGNLLREIEDSRKCKSIAGMEEGGSIAKRERDNQQFPTTIGAIAGMAPDVEDSFKIQDFSADEGKEQAAPGGEEGAKTAMPDSANKLADHVPESVKHATDAVPQGAKDALGSDATESVKEKSGAGFKK